MDNVGSGELEIYLRSYWDYYLALEGRLLQTERFCAFSERNAGAYSVEYLTLFLAACGEIDALGKEVARRFYPNVDLDRCGINKWGYYLCEPFPGSATNLLSSQASSSSSPLTVGGKPWLRARRDSLSTSVPTTPRPWHGGQITTVSNITGRSSTRLGESATMRKLTKPTSFIPLVHYF